MKRGCKALLLILVVSVTTIYFPNSSTMAFDDGDSFIYEITAASLYASIGENSNQNEGYYSGGEYHPTGTKVNATIVDHTVLTADFWFYIGDSYSVAHLSSGWLNRFGLELTYITLYYSFLMVENYNAINMFDLLTFKFHPIIYLNYCSYLTNPNSFRSAIDQLVDDWFYGEREIEYLTTLTEINGIIYFESWIGGKIDENFGVNIGASNDYSTDIKFGNNYRIAVNSTTGLVLGWGQRGWVKGRINEKQVRMSMEWQYELDGYAFPDYQFGEMKYFRDVNYYLIIFLPAISLGILIPVVIYFYNKHKFDKLLKES